MSIKSILCLCWLCLSPIRSLFAVEFNDSKHFLAEFANNDFWELDMLEDFIDKEWLVKVPALASLNPPEYACVSVQPYGMFGENNANFPAIITCDRTQKDIKEFASVDGDFVFSPMQCIDTELSVIPNSAFGNKQQMNNMISVILNYTSHSDRSSSNSIILSLKGSIQISKGWLGKYMSNGTIHLFKTIQLKSGEICDCEKIRQNGNCLPIKVESEIKIIYLICFIIAFFGLCCLTYNLNLTQRSSRVVPL